VEKYQNTRRLKSPLKIVQNHRAVLCVSTVIRLIMKGSWFAPTRAVRFTVQRQEVSEALGWVGTITGLRAQPMVTGCLTQAALAA
jgi:hypothetical protein